MAPFENSENIMLCSSQSDITRKMAKLVLVVWPLCLTVLLCGQTVLADTSVPAIPQPAEWTAGPRTLKLGTVAEIQVPEGFEFTDAQGARFELERKGEQVVTGLLGGLRYRNSTIWISYLPIGYVTDTEHTVDAAAILGELKKQAEARNDLARRLGKPQVTDLAWEVQPVYDPQAKCLEWVVRVESSAGASFNTSFNHHYRILGRHGVINAVVVRPYMNAADVSRLRDVARSISLKAGERYTDYAEGDAVAAYTVASLAAADPAKLAQAVPAVAEAGSLRTLWIGLGVASLVLVAILIVGIALVRTFRRHQSSTGAPAIPRFETAVAPEPAAKSAAGNGNGSPSAKSEQTAKPVSFRRPAAPHPGRNGSSSKKVNGSNRKRAFDYNRYFADLMSSVSSHSSLPSEATLRLRQPAENRVAGVAAPMVVPAVTTAPLTDVQAQMIASQKNLIEDQRRLIQEQTRLIEEKTRLIAEKNALLKLQSELIDNKLL